jgi:peptidyl-prolyl cis-trans isomerase B (cyclophilin B)
MKLPPWRQLVWAPLLFLALSFPLTLVACASDRGVQPLGCASSTSPCLSGTAVVALDTSRGRVLLRLDGDNAPLTAGNFVDLVRRGVYDGTVFHRVVREPVPFVVQGGDPASANPKVPISQYGSGNFIDPSTREARLIPLELKRQQEPEPSYGKELTTPLISKELALSHQRGSLAMARAQDPNSASAQFYIALEALPELDGRYAVFGQVIEGMQVVDAIRQGDKLVKASLMEGGKLVKGQP